MDINCKICGKLMNNVHHAVKYCSDCKKIALKNNHKKHYIKKSSIELENNKTKYKDNFIRVSTKPEYLTTIGFSDVSNLSVKSYCNFYSMTWIDIVKMFKKYDILLDYIVKEYLEFYSKTQMQNLFEMTKNHRYITRDLILTIGTDDIMSKAGIIKTRYTEDDYKENFNNIKLMLSRVPLYNEFVQYSKIPVESYAHRFNLKGKVYDNIVKMCTNDKEYIRYTEQRLEHKSKVGKITGKMTDIEIPLDILENELHNIFSHYYNSYGEYPSRRLFDRVSKYDSSLYRKRYNKSWLDVCNMLGYKINKNNKIETIVLGILSQILQDDYIPQKTWDWLIGVGGKNMFCDGYFENYKLVVEFDGRQHRVSIPKFGGDEKLKRQQENDKLKDKLVKQHKIKMLRIDSRDQWHEENYLIERLQEIGVKIPNQEIA